jgi:putative membrane protein
MKTKFILQTSLAAALCLGLTTSAVVAAEATIGKLEQAEFMKINEEAQATLAAIKPTSDPLSPDDEKLMMLVAAGGMMQLEASQVAVKMATSPDVRAIAEAEVAEQTGLSAKLKEVAAAKKVTLPAAPDEKTQKLVTKLQGMKGAEFDQAYLKEVGVTGHKKLNETMEKVESKADDPNLKAIASAALPLIKTHLQVAQDEMSAKK